MVLHFLFISFICPTVFLFFLPVGSFLRKWPSTVFFCGRLRGISSLIRGLAFLFFPVFPFFFSSSRLFSSKMVLDFFLFFPFFYRFFKVFRGALFFLSYVVLHFFFFLSFVPPFFICFSPPVLFSSTRGLAFFLFFHHFFWGGRYFFFDSWSCISVFSVFSCCSRIFVRWFHLHRFASSMKLLFGARSQNWARKFSFVLTSSWIMFG